MFANRKIIFTFALQKLKRSKMKRLLVGRLALVILCCLVLNEVGAQKVYLDANFENIEGVETTSGKNGDKKVDASTVKLNNGNLSFCYYVEDNGNTYLQLGDDGGPGAIFTPKITEIEGTDNLVYAIRVKPNYSAKLEITKTSGSGSLTVVNHITNDNNNILLSDGWATYYAIIRGADKETVLKIACRENKKTKEYSVLSSNLSIKSIPLITLNEDEVNSKTLLDNYLKEYVDLKLIRTFKGGIWNTVCLPFKSNYAVWHYSNIEGLTESLNPDFRLFQNKIDNSLHFVSTGDISGGTPYLLKIDRDLENPIFHNVVITTSTPSSVTDDNYSFVGTFGPTALKTDGTNVFLGTDNVLYKPAAGSNMLKGIRAYFEIPSGAPARISMDDSDEATGIKTLKSNVDENKVYNLHGQQLNRTAKGLYIINGKKIILK